MRSTAGRADKREKRHRTRVIAQQSTRMRAFETQPPAHGVNERYGILRQSTVAFFGMAIPAAKIQPSATNAQVHCEPARLLGRGWEAHAPQTTIHNTRFRALLKARNRRGNLSAKYNFSTF